MGALGQIAFFVALIVSIVVHELAHFFVARRFGIKVHEFFVGFGPRLWSTRRGETEYGVKALLFGGYVKIAGMNPFEETPPEDVPRAFGSKPIWQRALVIVAGPATHLVVAFVMFAIWLGVVGEPDLRSPLITLVEPTLQGEVSPAAQVGLRAGDRIVGIDDLRDPTDLQLVRYTRRHVGEEVTLTIERDGSRFTQAVTPVLDEVDGRTIGRIGVYLSPARETTDVLGAVAGGGRLVWRSLEGTVTGVARVFGPEGLARTARLLFTDEPRDPERDPASVIGIGRAAGQTAEAGRFWDILYIFAVVNVFIGLLNLLPLPPFDGGHLAVLAVEKVRGRPVDMRKVVPISAAVAAFFILFTFATIYLDITKPFNLNP